MIDIAKAKANLRLPADYTAEDSVIEGIIMAVTSYLTNLSGIPNDGSNPVYDLAALLLISHYYENREASTERHIVKIPYGVDALLATLRPAEGLI